MLRFVQGRVSGKRRTCVVAPLVRGSRSLSIGGTRSIRRTIATCCGKACRVNLLRNHLGSRRGSRVVHDFRGGRLRVLMSAAIVRINLGIPGTAIVIVRSTSQFKLSRLRRLHNQINQKSGRSCYILITSPGASGNGRHVHVVIRSASNFCLDRQSLRLHKPNSLFKGGRSNLPSFGSKSVMHSTIVLSVTRGSTVRVAHRPSFRDGPGCLDLQRTIRHRGRGLGELR